MLDIYLYSKTLYSSNSDLVLLKNIGLFLKYYYIKGQKFIRVEVVERYLCDAVKIVAQSGFA